MTGQVKSKQVNVAAKNLSDRRYLPKIVASKKSYTRKQKHKKIEVSKNV